MTEEAILGGLSIPDTRQLLWSLHDRLPMFVITDHPADWPDFYVARLHVALPAPAVTTLVIMDKSLERLRVTMEALGLVSLQPQPEDNPLIVETWL